ncbi:MAG: FAD-binding oxidoreductase [Planctomycetaceae bacterium]|jgi:glycolate oxidase FAD binding subunit|nr:FAD-binding oxidoreductase [bacterium]MDC0273121.1 FAD-binding oxidoreductase [Planctomycetaceae bacterium]MDG2387819.1 FAD-binding oxidoreductase [Planctomycetaceae bacterium]
MSQSPKSITEFSPVSAKELARFLRDNSKGERSNVFPVGGRTALQFLGPHQTTGTLLSTHQIADVIDYPARDMTITVGAGMRTSDLSKILAEENQELPIDISHNQRATIGGAISCNVSGPRRYEQGTFRDYLIGMAAVDAEGKEFHAGGRVVKNVAGYDLCKLMIGSRGTLGVLTEITLKVKPKQAHLEAVWINCESFEIIDLLCEKMLNSATRPVAMEAFTPAACQFVVADARISFPTDYPVMLVFYEGTEKKLLWQIGMLRSELDHPGVRSIEEVGDESSKLLLGTLTEFPDGGDVPATFQANMRPSRVASFLEYCTSRNISAVARLGNGIVTGHLPDDIGPETQKSVLDELSAHTHKDGGNLILLNAEEPIASELSWWGRAEQSWSVMKAIKQSLDPSGLLNPGGTPFE